MYFNRGYTYRADKALFATSDNIQKPVGELLERDMVSENSDNQYSIVSGTFIAEFYDTSNVRSVRPLPRAVLTAAAATGSADLTVDNGYYFLAGDVIYIALPYATFDVATTGAGSLTYNNTTISYTPTGAANTGEATTMSADYYNNSYLKKYFTFVADATNSVLYAFENHPVGGSDITGDGTVLQGTVGAAGDPQTTIVNTTALGTVQSVSTAGVVTLTANSAIAVPSGVSVGVNTVTRLVGMTTTTISFTSTRTSVYQGLAVGGNVYTGGLVYYDGSIGNHGVHLPELRIQVKF